jgi:hypothetical protein
MAKFLKSGPADNVGQENKAASKASLSASQSATTLRLIRLAKPANDNPVPLMARLRWWAPLVLMAVAAVIWHLLR